MLDPITFEVIKHRLWQINDEQAITIRTISSSPIVVEGNDFNVALFTREGDLVIVGPGSLVHATTMDTVIKSVIRMADEIEEGDMFLTNDPYIGALHQNDVAVVAPLFHEGKPLLWVGNVLHHADVGGIDEGSFCINATNVYQEPPRYFLKVVRRGKLSPEVERTFVANSRLPDMAALDLRAQIGAIQVTKARLQELLRERGVETVLATMMKAVDYAEERLRARIAELPDGEWHAEVFMDGDRRGSDRIYRVHLRLEKKGEELFFDYSGSDPQAEGAVNSTYHACYSGTVVPVYVFLCDGEIDWNSSIKRCVHVEAPEGTVMNARFPAAVSICTIGFRWLATAAATKVVAQMLSASEKYHDRVCPSWVVSSNGNNIFGIDSRGKRVGALLSDHRGGGAGARSFADGMDHAGMITSYLSFMANVESQEWKLPLLYVYRRQLTDSGGPGKYRGGLTSISAVVPYKASQLIFKSTNTAGADQSNAAGIDGGYPGAGSQVSLLRHTRVWQKLKEGRPPRDYEDFEGEVQHLPSKAEGEMGPNDVLVFYPPGGGGYGDPLERDPERVRRDVLQGAVSVNAARELYGVVLGPEMEVDEKETRRERERLIRERRSGARPPAQSFRLPAQGEAQEVRRAGEYLERVSIGGMEVLRCSRCGYVYCPAGEDPCGYALVREEPLRRAGPWLALRWKGESPNFVLVEHLCPGCGVLFNVVEKYVAGEGGGMACPR